jgi:two-component system, OmpR family, alkaline phosphatase synthesis response regulator PhoP
MLTHIIVVEDEPDIAELVRLHLSREGWRVDVYGDGAEGLAAVLASEPQCVVLDLMLPGLDGFQFCRDLKGRHGHEDLPVLVMSARSEEADVVCALELGADDYVVKPFSPRILVARVRNLLRRRAPRKPDAEDTLTLGPIALDSLRFEVTVDDERIDVTRTEFRLLQFLLERPGRVRERSEILEQVGGGPSLDRTVDVHVASLRRKLGAGGKWIETVRGVGYRAKEAR